MNYYEKKQYLPNRNKKSVCHAIITFSLKNIKPYWGCLKLLMRFKTWERFNIVVPIAHSSLVACIVGTLDDYCCIACKSYPVARTSRLYRKRSSNELNITNTRCHVWGNWEGTREPWSPTIIYVPCIQI